MLFLNCFLQFQGLVITIYFYGINRHVQNKAQLMKDNTNLFYATKLYKLRRGADVKQPQLANILGITQQAYSKLERGETNFSDEVIDAICKYFRISVAEFLLPIEASLALHNAKNSDTINSNNTLQQIIPAFLEEMKSYRAERQFYIRQIERLILILDEQK